MTTIETTFGNIYKVKETPEQIAEQDAKSNFLHLTRPNGRTISFNKLQVKSWN